MNTISFILLGLIAVAGGLDKSGHDEWCLKQVLKNHFFDWEPLAADSRRAVWAFSSIGFKAPFSARSLKRLTTNGM